MAEGDSGVVSGGVLSGFSGGSGVPSPGSSEGIVSGSGADVSSGSGVVAGAGSGVGVGCEPPCEADECLRGVASKVSHPKPAK